MAEDRCYYNPATRRPDGTLRMDRRSRCRKPVAVTLTTSHPGETGGLLVGVCETHAPLYLANGWHREPPR